MVLGKLPVPVVLLISIIVGQWPTALAVGAGGSCSDVFSLIYHFLSFSLSLGVNPMKDVGEVAETRSLGRTAGRTEGRMEGRTEGRTE